MRDKVAKLYLLTLTTIFEEAAKAEGSPLLKEILAAIGMLATLPDHRSALVSLGLLNNVLVAARTHIGEPKVVKTALGCLVNLTGSKDT